LFRHRPPLTIYTKAKQPNNPANPNNPRNKTTRPRTHRSFLCLYICMRGQTRRNDRPGQRVLPFRGHRLNRWIPEIKCGKARATMRCLSHDHSKNVAAISTIAHGTGETPYAEDLAEIVPTRRAGGDRSNAVRIGGRSSRRKLPPVSRQARVRVHGQIDHLRRTRRTLAPPWRVVPVEGTRARRAH